MPPKAKSTSTKSAKLAKPAEPAKAGKPAKPAKPVTPPKPAKPAAGPRAPRSAAPPRKASAADAAVSAAHGAHQKEPVRPGPSNASNASSSSNYSNSSTSANASTASDPWHDMLAAATDPHYWISRVSNMMHGATMADSLNKVRGQVEPLAQAHVDPAVLMSMQQDYQKQLGEIWMRHVERKPSGGRSDKRFNGPAWQGPHAYIAELYELNAAYMQRLADEVAADDKLRARIKFAVQQWVDAMAPTNFLATNPEAQQKLIATRGESLMAGIANMLSDAQKGRISQTDESVFEVGRNVATSAGAVVYQNEIFQLLQYSPLTPTVYERPILLVPPCINKYYILDLQPENSLVRHAVEQGHTVFLVSWRNPGVEQAHLTWDDYIEHGIIRAIDVAREIAGLDRINVLGFCVGGTMLATGLAVLAARGIHPAESLTLLTTLLDFSDSGVLDVFIDEASVALRERTIGGAVIDGAARGPCGLMPARDLATSFSFLRPNDLVWNYVVNNYLMGEAPPAFDLLYWNADSTNLPGPYFVWYLRNTYLENNLCVPGKLRVCGEPVDFGAIEAPAFIYGSREDHIVPWKSAYASTQLLKGPRRFVLGASGHIAGVINPPAKRKRNYWTYDPMRGRFPESADTWFNAAVERPGSWWPEWTQWLQGHAGKHVPVTAEPGNARYRVIEPAPGSYVRVRAM